MNTSTDPTIFSAGTKVRTVAAGIGCVCPVCDNTEVLEHYTDGDAGGCSMSCYRRHRRRLDLDEVASRADWESHSNTDDS